MDYELDPPTPSERRADADARKINTEIEQLQKQLADAEWLIRRLCDHEGAEGFSKYLHDRLDAYKFVTPEG